MTSNKTEHNDALLKVGALSIDAEGKENKEAVSTTVINQKNDEINEQKSSDSGKAQKATEQSIDPWSVEAATDEQGNTLEFDYVQISKYVIAKYLEFNHVKNKVRKKLNLFTCM